MCVIVSSFWSRVLITMHPKHSYKLALCVMIMFLHNPCGNDITIITIDKDNDNNTYKEIMMEGVFQYLTREIADRDDRKRPKGDELEGVEGGEKKIIY